MKNKTFFQRLISNNVVLLILSLLLSIGIWFAINASSDTDKNVTISDIPVTLELPTEAVEEGLQLFTGIDTKCSVEVSGNRVTVGSLEPSDIQITSDQTSTIIAPGTYNLPLIAKKVGLKTNYNIVSSVNPSTVTVFADYLKKKDFEIENQLKVKVDDGYYANVALSQPTVSVSGPDTEVSQINKVAIQGTVEGVLNSTKTVENKLIFLDKDGKSLDLTLTTADVEKVTVTLSVLQTKKVNLSVDVSNAPSDYPKLSISPETINIAGPGEVLKTIKGSTVNIGTVDFSKLRNENTTLNFDITLPKECKNISSDTKATVTVDLSKYKRAEFNCDISNTIDTDNYYCELPNKTVNVVIFGPESVLEDMGASDISVETNFTDKLSGVTAKATSIEIPLKITISKKYDECWYYGNYTVMANVSKKS